MGKQAISHSNSIICVVSPNDFISHYHMYKSLSTPLSAERERGGNRVERIRVQHGFHACYNVHISFAAIDMLIASYYQFFELLLLLQVSRLTR